MKEFKVQPIRNGTVIDHITPGAALNVLRILGLPKDGTSSVISVAINVPSGKLKQKDVVKIEDRELDPKEISKIALIAPHATISIVRNYEVNSKGGVELPQEVVGMARCENVNCITNDREPGPTRFRVLSKEPPVLECMYCGREVGDIAASLVRV
jgi:aspartate carbamoyltransferase regulatory subunit